MGDLIHSDRWVCGLYLLSTLRESYLYAFYVPWKPWEHHLYVFYMLLMLRKAELYVFYVSRKLWGVALYARDLDFAFCYVILLDLVCGLPVICGIVRASDARGN